MKTLKRLSALALALLMCLSLCACGSSTAASAKEARSESSYAPEPAMAYGMAADYDMAYEESGMGMTNSAAAKKEGSDTPE